MTMTATMYRVPLREITQAGLDSVMRGGEMNAGPGSLEFERGKDAGEISARLRQHDQHFTEINGSIAKMGSEMHQLNLKLQQVIDDGVNRDKTTMATALALKDEESRRRMAAELKWGRFQKVFAVLAGLAALVTVISVLIALFHH
jgi:hypothetical protein